MLRTPLPRLLAITAICALVQGCSDEGETTLNEEGTGEENDAVKNYGFSQNVSDANKGRAASTASPSTNCPRAQPR
jgi:hypothetical protein